MKKNILQIIALAVCVLWIISVVGLRGGEGFFGNRDEAHYIATAAAVAQGHPPYTETFSAQPPLWPVALGYFWKIGGLFGIRIFLGFMTVLMLLSIVWLASMISPKRLSLFVIAVTAASPMWIFFCRRIYAEAASVPAAALAAALSWAAWHRYAHKRYLSIILAAGCGTAACVAIMFKLSGVTVLPAVAAAAVTAAAKKQVSVKRTIVLVAVSISALTATSAAVLQPYPFRIVWENTVMFHSGRLSGLYAVPGLGIVLFLYFTALTDPPLVILGAIGLIAMLKNKIGIAKEGKIFLSFLLGGPLLFLLIHTPAFMHHGMVLGPFMAVPALIYFSDGLGEKRYIKKLAVLYAIFSPLLLYNHYHLVMTDKSEKPPLSVSVEVLKSKCTDKEMIITDDQLAAVSAGCSVAPPLVDTSNVRVQRGGITVDLLDKIAAKYDVKLVWAGKRLKEIKGFKDWLKKNFHACKNIDEHTFCIRR